MKQAKTNSLRRMLAVTLLCLLPVVPADSQSGGQFQITSSVIAGGGGTSTNGSLRVDGTIGQPAGAESSGGTFTLAGGFWPAASLSLLVVTNTNDSDAGSLRQAIIDANANPDLSFISFNIPASDPNCNATTHVCTITPTSILPTINQQVTIDGYTQPGASANTLAVGDNAVLLIEINGASAPGAAFIVNSANNTFKGLVINRVANASFNAGYAFRLFGAGNTIQGCYLGTNPAGDTASPNAFGGVSIEATSNSAIPSGNNLIGGATPAARNVIVGGAQGFAIDIGGNFDTFVRIGGNGNTVQGNYIGTNAAGSAMLGRPGISILTSNNTIGGTTALARNVTFSDGGFGIDLRESSSTGNTISGNFIGINATGTASLGGGTTAISLIRAPNNTIGGTVTGAGNVISGTSGFGILATDSDNLTIQGNLIGTNAAGTAAVPNLGGIKISGGVTPTSGGNNTVIGGTTAGARNIISGNAGIGVGFDVFTASAGNLVQGNYIGTDITGTVALGNGGNGLQIGNPTFGGPPTPPTTPNAVIVGGTTTGARNIISNSAANGIVVGTQNILVQGNFIGTDVNGTGDMGNGSIGISLFGNKDTIGGTAPGAGNIIAFSGKNDRGNTVTQADSGVVSYGTGNAIRGNSIFSNLRLGIDLPSFTENSFGVTPNDSCDADIGPNDQQASNNLQNYPVITSATSGAQGTTVTGTLNSTASATYAIDFYANPACDASGNGEGMTYLGATFVTTDASCNANINVTLPVVIAPGQVITATATDALGNTSEFSACRAAAAPPSVQFSAATYSANENAGTATITVTRTGGASGAAAVDYTTANGTAKGGAACASGVDYITNAGTLNWADGDSAGKTFAVTICNDNVFENGETVSLTLTNATGAALGTPATAVLTVTNDDAAPPPPNAGDVIISEFRFRGPTPATQPPADGALDEYIELYNATGADIAVGDPASNGWALVAANGAAPVTLATIPNGTIIPARGHYLVGNNSDPGGYSLSAYAVADSTYTTDIPDDAGLALFTSATPASLDLAHRLDAVGFSAVANPLYREGGGLTAIGSVDGQYSFVRKLATGLPQDTGNNTDDFVLVATDGALYGSVQAQLGAPGPENLSSPIQRNAQIKVQLIEPQQSSVLPPNRIRDANAVGPNAALGTLDIRRRFMNSTGQSVARLRFRIVDITTRGTPNPGGAQADLRLLTSTDQVVPTSLGNLTVRGTIIEQPPAQPGAGGLNSSAVLNLPGLLAPGATVDVRFVLGVQVGGSFRFLINTEALPAAAGAGAAKTGRRKY